jgi:hypothetical protein
MGGSTIRLGATAAMQMRKRMGIFVMVFFGTGLPMIAVTVEYQMIWAFLLWFALFAAAQFFIFRCPHCGKIAVFTPSGMAAPFVGTRCRHCGYEY